MPKNIRKRFLRVLRSTFRTEKTICCSPKKPDDYEFIPYQPKQTSTNNDYIELSQCQSWSMSQQLQSTMIHSDDSTSNISDLSSIRNVSTVQCCRCQCHHHQQHSTKQNIEIEQFNGRILKVGIRSFPMEIIPFQQLLMNTLMNKTQMGPLMAQPFELIDMSENWDIKFDTKPER